MIPRTFARNRYMTTANNPDDNRPPGSQARVGTLMVGPKALETWLALCLTTELSGSILNSGMHIFSGPILVLNLAKNRML